MLAEVIDTAERRDTVRLREESRLNHVSAPRSSAMDPPRGAKYRRTGGQRRRCPRLRRAMRPSVPSPRAARPPLPPLPWAPAGPRGPGPAASRFSSPQSNIMTEHCSKARRTKYQLRVRPPLPSAAERNAGNRIGRGLRLLLPVGALLLLRLPLCADRLRTY